MGKTDQVKELNDLSAIRGQGQDQQKFMEVMVTMDIQWSQYMKSFVI